MGLSQWWRNRKAEGIVRMLNKDLDPAVIDRIATMVDDTVIEALLVASERAERPGDALTWADIAVRASLLGGTAGGRADALMHRAIVVLDLGDGFQRKRLLQQAEDDALGVVEICRERAVDADLVAALCLLARVHTSRGHAAAMVEQMAECFRAAAGDPELRAVVSKLYADLYWELSKADAREVVALVIPELEAVLAAADGPGLRAEVLDALGRALSFHDENYDAAVETWSKSAALHHQVGEARGEFLVRVRIQWHTLLIDNDRSIQEGLSCLECAPEDTALKDLATVHHVLAAAYRYSNKVDEALAAYARTIDLMSRDPGQTVHDIVFEAATLLLEEGHHAEARNQLETAMAGPGFATVWWAVEVQLAELLSSHIGDLGAALQYAEKAVTSAVTLDNSDPMLRIISLQRAAMVHLMAGDFASSHRRFQLLVPLLTEPSRAITIWVNRQYEHALVPLPRSEILWNASLAARAVGDSAEADAWAARSAELRGTDPPLMAVDDDVLDDPETLAMAIDSRELSQAVALLHRSPAEALVRLAAVSSTLRADPNMRARVDMLTATCLEKLGDYDAALTAFLRALDYSEVTDVDQWCHWRVASIHHSRHEYSLAYPHLVACVRLSETIRTTFDDVEARMVFLRVGLARYERMIEVCLRLGRLDEALTVVQQVKSRALLDMLAQQRHRPVDPEFEARAAVLRDEHERWLAEFAAGTGPEGPAEEYLDSPQYRMLTGIVEHQKNTETLQQEQRELKLFNKLTDEGTPLQFVAIRELLASWESHV